MSAEKLLPRWDLWGDDGMLGEVESPNGKWVRYDDVKALLHAPAPSADMDDPTAQAERWAERHPEILSPSADGPRGLLTVEVGSLWDYDRSLDNSPITLRLEVKAVDDKWVEFVQKMPYAKYGVEYFDGLTFWPSGTKRGALPAPQEAK